jgi:DNA/RNA endonuclease YhcR with UshA esterase domain
MKALIAGLLLAAVALAHHSMAGFERTKTITVTGTVKQFKWANPHAWIEMEVPDGKGGMTTWNFEMTSPGVLARAGWKSTTVKPGDKVTMSGRPLLSGEPGALFVSVTLPDGRVMTERASEPTAAAK